MFGDFTTLCTKRLSRWNSISVIQKGQLFFTDDVVLVFLLITLNIFHTFLQCFLCWLWTSNIYWDLFMISIWGSHYLIRVFYDFHIRISLLDQIFFMIYIWRSHYLIRSFLWFPYQDLTTWSDLFMISIWGSHYLIRSFYDFHIRISLLD